MPPLITEEGTYLCHRMRDDEYPRGNVRMSSTGQVSTIAQDVADRMKVGRRENRPGLLYDASQPGFEPATWPHVVAAPPTCGSIRLLLDDGEGKEPTLLTVDYTKDVAPSLTPCTRTVLDEHRHVRDMESDPGAGYMVGAGMHMRRTGYAGPFYLITAGSKRRVASAMEKAGRDFHRHWVGRGAGYEEMLNLQREAFPKGTPDWPRHWDASQNLGNAMHLDPDGARSYAVWLSEHGHRSRSQRWWFLVPHYGVAIQIVHGTWLSWDGRKTHHCTAVPLVAEGDVLTSLFASIPDNLLKAYAKNDVCSARLRERSAPAPALSAPSPSLFEPSEASQASQPAEPSAQPSAAQPSARALRALRRALRALRRALPAIRGAWPHPL